MIKFFKKLSVWVIILIIVGAVVWGVVRWNKKEITYSTISVARANIERVVSITGRVKPVESVELAFEKSGKVRAIHAEVGKNVSTGALLAEVDHSDLIAQRAEAEAARAVQHAKLAEMKKGTRQEEIEVTKARVASARQALVDTETHFANVTQKANADLEDDYDSTRTALVKSINVALGSLYIFTDIQLKYYIGNDQESASIATGKTDAVALLLGASGAGKWTNDVLSIQQGGVKKDVQTMQLLPTSINTEHVLINVEKALASMKTALEAIPVTSKLTTTEATNLQTEKGNISNELAILAAKEQTILIQKTVNNDAVSTAQASVSTATNALTSAEAELSLKQAGATTEQIAAQEAVIAQADANLQSITIQIAKAFLYAPIGGVVTRQDAKVGEIVSANAPVISLISETEFEIEARVPEADIALVEIGDSAKVTLDAYGNDVVFDVKAVKIDPAEVIVEGVATYKVTFIFLKKDEHIKSGMTANIDVVTDSRSDVVVVPRHAVVKRNSDSFIVVPDTANNTREVKIKTGLVGSDGNVEIIEGIQEGDAIIISSPVL